MTLPNRPWSTSYPTSQDTVGTEQPDLQNDSSPGASDGHRVLVEHLHALRDKSQALAVEVGDSSSLPSGCLKDRVTTNETDISSIDGRVTTLEGASDADELIKIRSGDEFAGYLEDKLHEGYEGISLSVVAGEGGPPGDTLRLGLKYSTGVETNRPIAASDPRLSDSRTPAGSAGGGLGGTYPNPDVRKIRETSGPTELAIGSVSDGQFLKRSGTSLVGAQTGAFTSYEEEFTVGAGVSSPTFTLAHTPSTASGMLSGLKVFGVYRDGVRCRYRSSLSGGDEWNHASGSDKIDLAGQSGGEIITVVYGVDQ